jgi:uncharacterized protein YdhG (YjbR/CyaY superfamily)
MQSQAATVADYLAELPPNRRAAIEAVRQVILKNLDKDFEEAMQYGMIGYQVPHRVYPAGYHADPRQPLPFVCLASQKNGMSLYLSFHIDPAADAAFRAAWTKTGKKFDMGKSCVRFKRVEDLALDVIADAIRNTTARSYVAQYEASLAKSGGKRPKTAAKAKAKAKPAATKTKAPDTRPRAK